MPPHLCIWVKSVPNGTFETDHFRFEILFDYSKTKCSESIGAQKEFFGTQEVGVPRWISGFLQDLKTFDIRFGIYDFFHKKYGQDRHIRYYESKRTKVGIFDEFGRTEWLWYNDLSQCSIIFYQTNFYYRKVFPYCFFT